MKIYGYDPPELMLFAPETYHRIVEAYSDQIWPIQIVFLIIGFALIALTLRPHRINGRAFAFLLAFFWFWTGYMFHYATYASINWFAYFYAAIYFAQGLLLLSFGVFYDRMAVDQQKTLTYGFGLSFLIYGILVYPLISFYKSDFSYGELAGVFPIPTLIATFALLLIAKKTTLILVIIPAIAVLFETLLSIITQTYGAMVVTVIAIMSLIIMIWRKFRVDA